MLLQWLKERLESFLKTNDLKEIKEELKSNKLSYKNYLRYYKLAFLLNDKGFYELLRGVVPYDLNEITEERFGELDVKLKMKLITKY